MHDTKIGRYQIFYENEAEFHQLKREIFNQAVYDFETDNPASYIIDAGAHIGLSTLYFKTLFPLSRILAIEPDPVSRNCLEQMIFANDLDNITVADFALSVTDGTSPFYLPIDRRGWHMAAGLKLSPELDEEIRTIEVTTKTLQSVLNQPVDLLKIDIESDELHVLAAAKNQLHLVKEVILEFHPNAANQWADLVKFFRNNGFEKISRTDKPGELPPKDMAVIKAQR